MSKIKTLKVSDFRGIRDSSLELGGKSLLLLGENGTGKSSFIDALEFFYTGSVSHLEGAHGISTTRHAPHIRAKPENVAITIEFDQPQVEITRTLRDISIIPPELLDHCNLGANSKFILRRKNLLDFILSQPANRYEQLASIVGVSELDNIERAFLQTREEVEATSNDLVAQIDAHKNKLLELVGISATNDDQLLSALNKILKELKQSPLASLNDVEGRKLEIGSMGVDITDSDRALRVQNCLTQANVIYKSLLFPNEYRNLSDRINTFRSDSSRIRELLFQEVLMSSKRLIGEFADLTSCPVCMQSIDRPSLLNSLDERIYKVQAISAEAVSIKSLRGKLLSNINVQTSQLDLLIRQILELKISWNSNDSDKYLRSVEDILKGLDRELVDIHMITPEKLSAQPTIKNLQEQLGIVISKLEQEKKTLDKVNIQIISLLTLVMDTYNTLQALQPQYEAKIAVLNELSAIYGCFVTTKRHEIQKIYSELEGDITRYFRTLHSQEGYSEIKLSVNEGRRASTDIKMDFHDKQQEDPRAFNSEGHLDSLGLCVFLAFVKRFNFDFPIIVLDDVVSSIDAAHRQHICDLLFSEFPNSQLFITTHDYVWFEEFRSHQRACKIENLFENIQILNWSLDQGPRLDKYKPRWIRISEKIDQGDKDGAAADTRKELEAFLLEAAISLQTPIPLKRDGKYTVGDLHPPVVSRFKKLVPAVFTEQEEVFQNLLKNGIFGNLLVHNNPRAEGTSIEEVRGFSGAVKEFEKIFVCPECGGLVIYYDDAKVLKCRCKKDGKIWTTKE